MVGSGALTYLLSRQCLRGSQVCQACWSSKWSPPSEEGMTESEDQIKYCGIE